jgi:hypothetical protein
MPRRLTHCCLGGAPAVLLLIGRTQQPVEARFRREVRPFVGQPRQLEGNADASAGFR